MSGPRGGPPLRVPTLTEVVEFEPPAALVRFEPVGTSTAALSTAVPDPVAPAQRDAPPSIVLPSAETLQARVLAQVQRQLDASAESRLREAIAPVLARAADGLIRELEAELAATLQDLVARAVAQELARASAAAGRDGETTPD